MNHRFIERDQHDFRQLPSNVATYTQRLVHEAWRSFFKLEKRYYESLKRQDNSQIKNNHDPNVDREFIQRPGLPHYLDPKTGRQTAVFTERVFSRTALREGKIVLCDVDHELPLPDKIDPESVTQIRIVPKVNGITVEVVYKIPMPALKKNGKKAAGDLGVNNLIAIAGERGVQPKIFNGRPAKSINQFYNKRKAELQEKIPKHITRRTTNRIRRLAQKRYNILHDYLHQVADAVVNHLVSNDVTYFVVGLNKGWKQEINIGKSNNQKFVSIPHTQFVEMLRYKCALAGIHFETINEAYTSKCSFLDNEPLRHRKKYMGKRVHRGLFRASDGRFINADIHGAYNTLRKAIGKEFDYDPIEACGAPSVYTVQSSPKRRRKEIIYFYKEESNISQLLPR